MTILEWEEQIKKLYNIKKVQNFDELKYYLTNINYYPNFEFSEVSEGQFYNEDFACAYVFDEKEILKKNNIVCDSGWNTTIIMLVSEDKENVDDYHIVGLNGFKRCDVRKFIKNTTSIIGGMEDEK